MNAKWIFEGKFKEWVCSSNCRHFLWSLHEAPTIFLPETCLNCKANMLDSEETEQHTED